MSIEELRVGFPRPLGSDASPFLDALVAEIRASDCRTASVWVAGPHGPAGLAGRLLARGFETGWQAHWMGLSLASLSTAPRSEVQITFDGLSDVRARDDIPYGNLEEMRLLRAAVRNAPETTWCARALVSGTVVGQAVGYRSTGKSSFAGIYSMGVSPFHRRQGIGRALVAALASRAFGAGCEGLVLNSAADAFYRSLGFVSLGHGQTWWWHRNGAGMEDKPPWLVGLVEAVGDGDLSRAEAFSAGGCRGLDCILAGGMSLPGLALRCRQRAMFDWLDNHGAPVDVVEAWDRGGAGRALALLTRFPMALENRRGPFQAPPLHRAVARGDLRLARWLLARGASRDAVDGHFGGTAARWSVHCGHPEWERWLAAKPGEA